MPVVVEETGGQCLVKLQGELIVRHAAEIKDALSAQLQQHDHLDIDLSGVTKVDTSGLQLMVAVKHCEGKTVHFIHHSESVLHALSLINLPLIEDEADAAGECEEQEEV